MKLVCLFNQLVGKFTQFASGMVRCFLLRIPAIIYLPGFLPKFPLGHAHLEDYAI